MLSGSFDCDNIQVTVVISAVEVAELSCQLHIFTGQ